MDRVDRTRRKAPLGAELLEGRRLLNAHFARPSTAHVHALTAADTPPEVTGVVTGPSSDTNNPQDPNIGTESFNGTGVAGIHKMTVSGGDHYVGQPVSVADDLGHHVGSPATSSPVDLDRDYDGHLTITLRSDELTTTPGSDETIDVTFTGHGSSDATDGSISEILHGEGVVTSGTFSGQHYTFDAILVGSNSFPIAVDSTPTVMTILLN